LRLARRPAGGVAPGDPRLRGGGHPGQGRAAPAPARRLLRPAARHHGAGGEPAPGQGPPGICRGTPEGGAALAAPVARVPPRHLRGPLAPSRLLPRSRPAPRPGAPGSPAYRPGAVCRPPGRGRASAGPGRTSRPTTKGEVMNLDDGRGRLYSAL